jgi:hypothetical protein
MQRLASLRAEGEDVDDGFFMASLGSLALTQALSGGYQPPPEEMVVKRVGGVPDEDNAWYVFLSLKVLSTKLRLQSGCFVLIRACNTGHSMLIRTSSSIEYTSI